MSSIHRTIIIAAVALLPVLPAQIAHAEAPPQPCDVHFIDPMLYPIDGYLTPNLRSGDPTRELTNAVVRACEDAIAHYPNETRFRAQLFGVMMAQAGLGGPPPAGLAETADWLVDAAAAGDPLAQTIVGTFPIMFNQPTQAFSWLIDAAEGGYPPAVAVVDGGRLRMLPPGSGVEQPHPELMNHLVQAADRHYAVAEFLLYQAYQRGTGVAQDDDQALYWLTRAAEHGFSFAQHDLSTHYRNRDLPDYDPVTAAIWRARSDEGGSWGLRFVDQAVLDAAARRLLVDLGYALPPDDADDLGVSRAAVIAYQRDIRWPARDGVVTPEVLATIASNVFRPRAAPPAHPCDIYFGDPMVASPVELAAPMVMPLDDRTQLDTVKTLCEDAVARYPGESRYLVELLAAQMAPMSQPNTADNTTLAPLIASAEAGDDLARTMLWTFTDFIHLNEDRGMRWLLAAADDGYPPAQFIVAAVSFSSSRHPQLAGLDPDGITRLRAAAEAGYAPAQVKLGQMYQTGDRVPQNPAAALRWITRSAEQGYFQGQIALETYYGDETSPHYDPAQATLWSARRESEASITLRDFPPAVIDAAARQALTALGYEIDDADAAGEAPTRAAVLAFQHDFRWPERDGLVTPELLSAIAHQLDVRTP